MCYNVRSYQPAGVNMAYDNLGRYNHTRILSDVRDPYKASAESLARSVEDFLYNTESHVYANTKFLAWAIAKFDASKQGSGHTWDSAEYVDSQASIEYLNPPFVHVGDGVLEYRVEYSRDQFNAGEVPTSYDGTQVKVYENHVEQVIRPADEFTPEEN